MSHQSNKKQSMMEANVKRRERRCRPWFILTLFVVVMVVAILTLLLANIPTTRNQLWDLYQVLQEHTEKYLYDMTLPQHCYRPI
ncbi:unnamed protein product [Oncorhynchus mykiss]|nr:unnamed protein product [Oncorhynchus mykiss]